VSRGDVSFTFLSRIEEIESNIAAKHYQAALALTLTLPDICGGIEYPEVVRTYRDGRIIREKNGRPSRDIGKQYIRWVDEFAADYLKKDPSDEKPYVNGERCWRLRCEYLHQNKGFDNEDEDIHFHLGINCGTSICHLDTEEEEDGIPQIRLDIQEFCRRISAAARDYYAANQGIKEFELYNTPVIDFVKWNEAAIPEYRSVHILTKDKAYGRALKNALEAPGVTVMFSTAWEDLKWKQKQNRANLWIVDEAFLELTAKDQGGTGPDLTYILGRYEKTPEEIPTNLRYIHKGMSLKELRRQIRYGK